jgi:hypothetical protein
MCLSENSQIAGRLEPDDSFQRRPESRTCLKIQAAIGHEECRSRQVTGRPAQWMHDVATISGI